MAVDGGHPATFASTAEAD
jgi:hypothetical protein